MRYAMVVHVVERLQYTEDDGYSDLLRHRLLRDDLAQGPSLYPLHHSVESTPHGHFIHLHYSRVIQPLSDFGFTHEALVQYKVAFHFFMRKLDRDGLAVARVGRAKNGRHATAGDQRSNLVMVQPVALVEVHRFGNFPQYGGKSS